MTKEVINGVRYTIINKLPSGSFIIEKITDKWKGRKLITEDQYKGKVPIDWDVFKQEKEMILSMRFKEKALHRNNEITLDKQKKNK